MKVTRKGLQQAADNNIISIEQADNLHLYLQGLSSAGPRFDFIHVLYYLGGCVAIGAMSLFMNLGWESFGGWGILCMCLAYAGIGWMLTQIPVQRICCSSGDLRNIRCRLNPTRNIWITAGVGSVAG